ncbi:MAG: T9SS type A sorting domain-containing protein [Bacteroidetes bacterium]|nr:T9SS type A sorting domain-containing protein [Bacteroidota bacterium]
MKKLLLLFVTLCSLSSSAQTIPNAGFENWQPYDGALPIQVPQGWWSYDVLVKAFHPAYTGSSVLQTNQSHSGTSAILMQTNISNGDTINGRVFSSDSVELFGSPQGFSFNLRPATFSGYYKLNLVGNDSAAFAIIMTKWNGNHRDTIVAKVFAFGSNVPSYTQFNFPITYLLNQFPDTAYIVMGIVGPNNKVSHVGTQFFVDDLSFSGSVPLGIKENSKENNLVSFYPNPFSNTAEVSLNTTINLNNTQLIICDITGKEVKKIKPTTYKTTISREGLEKGIYFYKLFNSQTITSTGKFVIE